MPKRLILFITITFSLFGDAMVNGAAAAAPAAAEIEQKQLDIIQRIFKKTYKKEHVKRIDNKGKFSEVGNIVFTYSGITHRNDLKKKLSDMLSLTAIPSEKQKLILPTDVSGEISDQNFLIGTSIKGRFEYNYLHFSPVDATMNYFTVAGCSINGTMTLFPDESIDVTTRGGFLYEHTDMKITHIPRGVTMEDIDAMFSIMMQPIAEMSAKLLRLPPPPDANSFSNRSFGNAFLLICVTVTLCVAFMFLLNTSK